ncbi:MAG: phage holin family protein [Gammaproteobacteria bacterium]|nr:phage holin family protein [Gammaproteobacteria bacterium]
MKLPLATTTESNGLNPLDAVRILHTAGGALFDQARLHGQLARIEWEEAKNHWLKMLAAVLFGFICLLCCLLFAGELVLVVAWDTPYRIPAILGLVLLFGMGSAVAWRRFQVWSASGGSFFATSREELAADVALLKSNL